MFLPSPRQRAAAHSHNPLDLMSKARSSAKRTRSEAEADDIREKKTVRRRRQLALHGSYRARRRATIGHVPCANAAARQFFSVKFGIAEHDGGVTRTLKLLTCSSPVPALCLLLPWFAD